MSARPRWYLSRHPSINLEKMMMRNVLSSLQARNEPRFSAVATGSDEVNGKRVDNVAVDYDGQLLSLGVDSATGRALTLSYVGRGPEGDYGPVVQTLSDYRTVNGVTLPERLAT